MNYTKKIKDTLELRKKDKVLCVNNGEMNHPSGASEKTALSHTFPKLDDLETKGPLTDFNDINKSHTMASLNNFITKSGGAQETDSNSNANTSISKKSTENKANPSAYKNDSKNKRKRDFQNSSKKPSSGDIRQYFGPRK